MILLTVIVVFIVVLFFSIIGALNFFDKREKCSDSTAFFGTMAFGVLCLILSMYLVIAVPVKLALKYCDYEPVYSHSRPIYNLQEDYITDFDENYYMIYTNDLDGNDIRPKYLLKETIEIFDIDTNTPCINYYSPKFKNKLVDLYFCQIFTINKYDIYI